MNSISTTQFDEFLNFADLFLLQVSFRGNLVNFRPRDKQFLGWSFENRLQFNLVEHLLKSNHMTLDLFLKFTEDRDYSVEHFSWKSPDGKISSPYLTFFRTNEIEQENKDILIFVKNQTAGVTTKLSISDRSYTFQAKHLPGFIHNLNGPLSTILGRIELLQLKYPDIEEFDEIVKVGYKLQSAIDNLSFKIQNESDSNSSNVNLNRLIREEVNFLNCDLFFKHHVEKIKDLANDIPEFNANYLSISGILSECYQFVRQFVDEQKEYMFKIKSFCEGNNVGFSFEFTGNFKTPGQKGNMLPFVLEGKSTDLIHSLPNGLDKNFLSHCMKLNDGYLYLDCNINSIKFKYKFAVSNNESAMK